MATRRQTRYYYRVRIGYLPFEARELASLSYTEAPYLRKMDSERERLLRAFVKQAQLNRWSKTQEREEYRKVIKQEYLDHGWIKEKAESTRFKPAYKASVWAMLREYRQQAIEAGEYFPQPRKRVRRDANGKIVRLIPDKGNVAAQKRRYRARMEQRRGSPDYEQYLARRREQKRRARQRERHGK